MRIWLLLLVALIVPTQLARGSDDAQEEAAVRALIDQLTAAYNRHDAKAMAALFELEADIVSINTYHGREGIERFFAGMSGDPIESPAKTASVRFLTPDVAILDVETDLPGIRGSNGESLPNVKFKAFFAAKKSNGKWLFAALRVRALTTSP